MRRVKAILSLLISAQILSAQKPLYGPGSGGGGGGAAVTSLRELTDCKITRTSATVLTIAACPMRIGENVVDLAAATVTLSGASSGSTVDLRITEDGALTAVNPGATTATCANCTTSAVTPDNTIRVGTATYTSGAWDVGGIVDQRTMVGRDLLAVDAPLTLTKEASGLLRLGSTQNAGLKSITVFDPVTGDSGRIQFEFPVAVTITRISCSVKAATSATINLDERAEATPDTSGTAVLTSGLACDVDSAASTTFSNAGIAANVPVALTISAVSGTPDTLRVHIEYTVI